MSSLIVKPSTRRPLVSKRSDSKTGKLAQTKKRSSKKIAVRPNSGLKKKVSAPKNVKKPSVAVKPTKKKPQLKSIKRAPAKKQGSKTSLRKTGRQTSAKPTVMARKPGPKIIHEPPKLPPSPATIAAFKSFEAAIKIFNKREYQAARAAFESIIERYTDQADVIARVRTYISICDQRMVQTPSAPRTPEALYDRGVFEFNRGNTSGAIDLFEKALKVQPRADHILYSLATAYSRQGNASKALEALRQAISISLVHRSRARYDPDFASIRGNLEFQRLAGLGLDYYD